jgi:phage terminase small subunit
MTELRPKQQRFVDEYLIDLNATQAAIRAGYSAKTARQIGEQNLSKIDIKEAIQARMAARAQNTEVTQEWVVKAIKKNYEEARTEKEFNAVNKALELLGKHVGMFNKVELDGTIKFQAIERVIIEKAFGI